MAKSTVRTYSTKSHDTAFIEAKRLIRLGNQFSYYEDEHLGHTFAYPVQLDYDPKIDTTPKEVG